MVIEPEPMYSVIVPICPVKRVLARFGWNFGRILGWRAPAGIGMAEIKPADWIRGLIRRRAAAGGHRDDGLSVWGKPGLAGVVVVVAAPVAGSWPVGRLSQPDQSQTVLTSISRAMMTLMIRQPQRAIAGG